MFITSRDSYKLYLEIDEKPIFDNLPFEWFLQNSAKLVTVGCDYDEEANRRILVINNLPFSRSISLTITPITPILFIEEVYYLIVKEVVEWLEH